MSSEPPASPPPQPRPARLMRSRSDRMLAGVCGGVAVYLNVDPTLVRIGTVVLAFISAGAVLVGYLLAWLLIPEESSGAGGGANPAVRGSSAGQARLIVGTILVVIGGLGLLRAIIPGVFGFTTLWPLILVALGVLLITQSARR